VDVTVLRQVQPDLEDLAVNMEDNEGAEHEKSLGKLQFSLDYDFQKGEVPNYSVFAGNSFVAKLMICCNC